MQRHLNLGGGVRIPEILSELRENCYVLSMICHLNLGACVKILSFLHDFLGKC